MNDRTDGAGVEQSPIEESDRCPECKELPKLVEEASESPLSGKKWDRYKCSCGHATVRVPHGGDLP